MVSEVGGVLIDGVKRTHALSAAVSTIAATARSMGGSDILRHLIVELGGMAHETLELAKSLESAIAMQREHG
jgi:hypothetical protein